MPSPYEDGTYTDGGRLPLGPGTTLLTSNRSAPDSTISAKLSSGVVLTRAAEYG